ncbi:MAG: hypothetical protein LBM66_02175 [Bifidobacteriaceae bacterium]|jgi:hypothetical protein|nr:hypothetical protein [Bifidobacteriaceae bacterium]
MKNEPPVRSGARASRRPGELPAPTRVGPGRAYLAGLALAGLAVLVIGAFLLRPLVRRMRRGLLVGYGQFGLAIGVALAGLVIGLAALAAIGRRRHLALELGPDGIDYPGEDTWAPLVPVPWRDIERVGPKGPRGGVAVYFHQPEFPAAELARAEDPSATAQEIDRLARRLAKRGLKLPTRRLAARPAEVATLLADALVAYSGPPVYHPAPRRVAPPRL